MLKFSYFTWIYKKSQINILFYSEVKRVIDEKFFFMKTSQFLLLPWAYSHEHTYCESTGEGNALVFVATFSSYDDENARAFCNTVASIMFFYIVLCLRLNPTSLMSDETKYIQYMHLSMLLLLSLCVALITFSIHSG